MKFQYTFKFLAIIFISIGLIVALASIEHKVDERFQYRAQAKSTIANGWSGRQVIMSPVLRLTLNKQYTEEVFDKHLKKYVSKPRSRTWTELRIPDQLEITSEIFMQDRTLGIYTIPVYETDLKLHGEFRNAIPLAENVSVIKAELITSFQDMRGISNTPSVEWNDQQIEFQPGDSEQLLGSYISATLTNSSALSPARFTFSTRLRGLDAIRFVPAAKQVQASVTSSWPHPYFEGRYLPVQREISEQGFSARWEVTEFATSIHTVIATCQEASLQCAGALQSNTFGVGLHNPIDVYQQTDRSLKYGFLFIALTFLAFLLFEVIKRIKIHPIQYALVGCALAIFYLLLISLSEHISFNLSYLIATMCCVALIGFYLCFVLERKSQAIVLSAGMTLLYGTLFVILKSEDSAMIMGTILSFVSLAALMIITRNIDWYELVKPQRKPPNSDDALPTNNIPT